MDRGHAGALGLHAAKFVRFFLLGTAFRVHSRASIAQRRG